MDVGVGKDLAEVGWSAEFDSGWHFFRKLRVVRSEQRMWKDEDKNSRRDLTGVTLFSNNRALDSSFSLGIL